MMRGVTRHNIVRRESFAERLENLMIRYMRQQLSSAEMIAELVAMAKEVSADARRGERFNPPLNHAESAFYDAVAHQGMARALMGDDTLAKIARALVADIRENLSVDWLSREPVRAKLRTRIRRLLAKFDYPPEEEREAVDLVINRWRPSPMSGHRKLHDGHGVSRPSWRAPQFEEWRAGMAALGATSLNWASVGSAADHRQQPRRPGEDPD
jgi:restriction endonuclease HindI-like protein